MTDSWTLVSALRSRVQDERGTIRRQAERRVALVYPSSYGVGMSSLGFQAVYARWNDVPGFACERAFLPDDVAAWRSTRLPLITYESESPVGGMDVVAFSIAYELELPGLLECLALAGLPLLASERGESDPVVVVGGPLTFSNPLPLGPFADAVVIGEAEDLLAPLCVALSQPRRSGRLAAIAALPSCWVPSLHDDCLPEVARAADAQLPACSSLLTPHTELHSMFLVEAERGCSRGCRYCVMGRGGMRLVPIESILAKVPDDARRVGLVGAAVSDHPELARLLGHLVERGCQVGISSLRPERLSQEIVSLLASGGYRAITVAADGASGRLRASLGRNVGEDDLLRACELARQAQMEHVKVYQMLGVPDENYDDLAELAQLTRRMSKILPVVLALSPFVAKRGTPLAAAPFAGIGELERRVAWVRKELRGEAEVRPASARWSWVEYLLAQGGRDAGLRALTVYRAGGGFAAWKRAFKASHR